MLLTSCTMESSNNTVRSTPSTVNIAEVEGVKVIKPYPNSWAVSGMVRNTSSKAIKGAVKIKFLNSNGDVVHSNRAKVNDGDPIDPRQAANFEYYADPSTFDAVTDFKVEFYER